MWEMVHSLRRIINKKMEKKILVYEYSACPSLRTKNIIGCDEHMPLCYSW